MPTEPVAAQPPQEPVTCAFCGRRAPEGAVPLTWSTAVENGRRCAYCDVCSRRHVRSMEGKLDSEHW